MSFASLPPTERALVASALILAIKVASGCPKDFKAICDNWLQFDDDERNGEDLDWEREDWLNTYRDIFFSLAARKGRKADPRFSTTTAYERGVAVDAVELAMNVIHIPDPNWVCKVWLTGGRPATYSPTMHNRCAGDFASVLSHFAEKAAA